MPVWLEQRLPPGLRERLVELLSPAFLTGLGIFSVVSFIASLVGVPFFLSRLPADYFSRREQLALGIDPGPRPWYRTLLAVSKNVLGWCLILVGIPMLVLPGQGLLTILVGVLMIDFPGKRRFERTIIARPRVLATINALRRRAGRPPIEARTSWVPANTRQSRSSLPPQMKDTPRDG